ncbi:MAG: DMT family transporter [Desulfovibrionaceae bacterium]|nr:DMT family transporter [Desulfovibrionaceae bacterium]
MILSGRLVPHAAVALAILVWSSSFIALKMALSAYSPLTVMAGRMLTASLLCLPLLPAVLRFVRRSRLRVILLVCVLSEPCLYFLCETFALRATSSAQAGMVISLLPLPVAAGAWLLLGERLPGRAWLGFAVSIAGVTGLTLSAEATENAPHPVLGNLLEGGAVLCAAAYTLCVKRLTSALSPTAMTAAMSFAGALFFGPLALLPLSLGTASLAVDLPAWAPAAAIVYLGSLVTFAGYGLYNFGVSRLDAGRVAAYMNLSPVATLLMSVIWLGDVLSPAQYLASALVLAGLALTQSGGRTPASPPGDAA